jgi:tRNA1(Val) A37 N6-methylase TrmN6
MGLTLRRGERVHPFGDGWLIAARGGFEPCPWSFELAKFCQPRIRDRVLDLGCGAGPLLVALGQLYPQLGLRVGIELLTQRADQAQRNLTMQRVGKFGVIRGDIRNIPVPSAFDLVVVNPPFYPPGWGRVSEDPSVAQATHALNGDVTDFVRAAARALAPHGAVVIVFDSNRLADLLLAISCAGLMTKRMRFLDDDRGKPSRVLVQAGRDGAGIVVERSMYL